MLNLLADTETGVKLGPTGSLILGGVSGLLFLYLLICVAFPSIRGIAEKVLFPDDSDKNDRRRRRTAVFFFGWAIMMAGWTVALIAHGLNYPPVERNTLPILGGAFAFMMVCQNFDAWRTRG